MTQTHTAFNIHKAVNLTEFPDFRFQTSTTLLCRPASRWRLRRLTVTSDRSSSTSVTRGWADAWKPCWTNTRIRASSSLSEQVSSASVSIMSLFLRAVSSCDLVCWDAYWLERGLICFWVTPANKNIFQESFANVMKTYFLLFKNNVFDIMILYHFE